MVCDPASNGQCVNVIAALPPAAVAAHNSSATTQQLRSIQRCCFPSFPASQHLPPSTTQPTPTMQSPRAALLVTAHPDDEAMFFAPALQQLQQRGALIHILCLSNGNGAGLGRVREKELLAAARVLHVPAANVTTINDPQLQDGMQTHWPAAAVAQQVERQLLKTPCDLVLTFDAHGVSGHINHTCVHEGVRQLLAAKGRALGVRQAWQLVSEAWLVKYSCVLALPLTAVLRRPGQLVVRGGAVRSSLRAMAAHRSQWVWYRKLFVLFSSYTYVNRLQPMAVVAA